ncbi:MAG: UDP-N-acetylmuramate--L-alanine ligase, partial [Betaproteobacteria bacterium]|nr:UDP-N-acetylmuramate--L-alanine ligase [Betaproteobacteria bacterium]
ADGRALVRALRVAHQLEPVFVADVGDMPQALYKLAQDGDVVLCMGAGTIGQVPAKVVQLMNPNPTPVPSSGGQP